MDLLLLILIVLLVLSMGGWGYGYYTRPARVADADVVAAPAAGGNILGILAVVALVAIVLMLITNWRPLGPVF